MKKFHIKSVIFLLGLFVSTLVLAEVERQPKIEKAATGNLVDQSNDRQDKEIQVRVQNDGERILVYAAFTAPVGVQQAWAVLTDFENLPNFISGVQSSRVTSGAGNNLQVSQRGITQFGFFTFSFDSVREVNLSPFNKIQERMISGNMRKMEETTVLSSEGSQTRIVYQADIVPGHWMLRFAGQFFIENEAREQFQQIKTEMIRRGKVIASPRERL